MQEDNSGARSKPYFFLTLSMHLHSIHFHNDNVSNNVGQSKLSSSSPSTACVASSLLPTSLLFSSLPLQFMVVLVIMLYVLYPVHFQNTTIMRHYTFSNNLCIAICNMEMCSICLNRRFQFCRNIHIYE